MKHPHYNEIIAWANGSKIQYKNESTLIWKDAQEPIWDIETEYRIKPTYLIIKSHIFPVDDSSIEEITPLEPNVEFWFDSETKKLVDVKIIESNT